MAMLTWSSFVLQRRVNQPFGAVGRVVCDPWLLHEGTRIKLDDDVSLQLDRPFGVTFPMFRSEGASWTAPASIRSQHDRCLEHIEIELNAWDDQATELVVRPLARSPYNWHGRHLRRYFRLAHEAADALSEVLATDTPHLEPVERRSAYAGAPPD